MSSDAFSPIARQYERHATEYEARIEVHPDHVEQFRLALPDACRKLAVVDVSAGGLAIRTGFFVPKNLRLTVHVSAAGDDARRAVSDLVVRGTVRRCVMLDHKPTYHVGLQFLDANGRDEQALVRSAAAVPAARPAEAGGFNP